jgi:hypothetical protein
VTQTKQPPENPGRFKALPTIDRDIKAVKWRLWHGRVDRTIRDLESLLVRLNQPQGETEFSIARLRNLGVQLLSKRCSGATFRARS